MFLGKDKCFRAQTSVYSFRTSVFILWTSVYSFRTSVLVIGQVFLAKDKCFRLGQLF